MIGWIGTQPDDKLCARLYEIYGLRAGSSTPRLSCRAIDTYGQRPVSGLMLPSAALAIAAGSDLTRTEAPTKTITAHMMTRTRIPYIKTQLGTTLQKGDACGDG